MRNGIEIQGHGRVGFDDFSVLDAYVAVVDQLLQAVNELWRDAVAVFGAEAPGGHDGRDSGVEIAVGKTGCFLRDVEVVDENTVDRNLLISIDFRDDGTIHPKIDRHIHSMEN